MQLEWKDVWPYLLFAAVAIIGLWMIYSVLAYVFNNLWIVAILLIGAAAFLVTKYYPKTGDQ